MDGKDEQYSERIIKTDSIYEGRIVDLRVDTVELPNMVYAKREIVDHPRGVGICAVTEDLQMYMVRQYRAAVHDFLLEIPAGLVEEGENPEDAAIRELQEEVGFKPAKMDFICDAYSSPGFTNEKLSLFVARDLQPSKLPEDEDENIQAQAYPIEDLYKQVLDLEIEDAKSIIGILYVYFNIYLKGKRTV